MILAIAKFLASFIVGIIALASIYAIFFGTSNYVERHFDGDEDDRY